MSSFAQISGRHKAVTLALGLLLLLLNGCGFTLRGADSPMMLDTLVLDAQRPDGIVRTLRQRLETQGVDTRPVQGARPHYRLVLSDERRDARRTTASAGTTGAQYELTLSVELTLLMAGTVIAGPRGLEVQRQQDEDISNLTSSDSERDMLYRDMERELTDEIIAQLRTLPPATGQRAGS